MFDERQNSPDHDEIEEKHVKSYGKENNKKAALQIGTYFPTIQVKA